MVDEHEESFAELFEESLQQEQRTVEPGEKVTGTVIQVGADRLYLDLAGGLEGMIELSEFDQEKPRRGDRVEGFVVSVDHRVVTVAKSLGKGPAARKQLEDAAETGIPVEGLVVETNKGGFVVDIAGVRCFCPIGQMDVRRIEDPAVWIGQRLNFAITEWRSGRDVVVSRRVLLEAEQADRARETRERLEIGARFSGEITNVRDFGAFVDIGGLEGLVPASQMGWSRSRPQDAVQIGQRVEVEVIDINPPGPKDRSERITLSMRALEADPWDELLDQVSEGVVVRGTVVRLQPFGAFVELIPGVDGLLHVGAFGRKVSHPAEVVSVGDEIAVCIDSIDPSQRRLSLSFVEESALASLEGAPQPEQAVEVQAAEPASAKPVKAPTLGVSDGMRVRRASKAETPKTTAAEAEKTSPEAPTTGQEAGSKLRVLGRTTPAAPRDDAPQQPRAPRVPASLATPPVGTVLQVTVDRIESFGLFVTWGAGRGLLPASELDLPKHADLKKLFPVGTELEAAIVDVRPDGKVRLSVRAAEEAKERAEAKAWMDSNKPAGEKGFGTFADLFSKALKK